MRIWIAALLLLVFACQALPLTTVMGKQLAKVQLSVADTDDSGDDTDNLIPDGKLKKQSPLLEEDYAGRIAGAALLHAAGAAQLLRLHRTDHLPVLYKGEVTTPPPDCC